MTRMGHGFIRAGYVQWKKQKRRRVPALLDYLFLIFNFRGSCNILSVQLHPGLVQGQSGQDPYTSRFP